MLDENRFKNINISKFKFDIFMSVKNVLSKKTQFTEKYYLKKMTYV